MVGSSIWGLLHKLGYDNLIGVNKSDLDLRNQKDVEFFFNKEKPDYVIIAAAKVGGIVANNTFRADFIYDNLQIQNNIIHQSYLNNVKKLLFLGSSCIYPRDCNQPIKEEYLLDGKLEFTNEPYAIAKIAGIKMCENYYRQHNCNFISIMPTNLYGINDNFDFKTSHVLPALIRKFYLGKCLIDRNWDSIIKDLNLPLIKDGIANENNIIEILNDIGITYIQKKSKVNITLWGTGQVYREFLYVDDLANAVLHIIKNIDAKKLYDDFKQTHINIGTGEDLTIKNLAELISQIIGYNGDINWDISKPDGTLRKKLDVSLLNQIKWYNKISLKDGIIKVYKSYIDK